MLHFNYSNNNFTEENTSPVKNSLSCDLKLKCKVIWFSSEQHCVLRDQKDLPSIGSCQCDCKEEQEMKSRKVSAHYLDVARFRKISAPAGSLYRKLR